MGLLDSLKGLFGKGKTDIPAQPASTDNTLQAASANPAPPADPNSQPTNPAVNNQPPADLGDPNAPSPAPDAGQVPAQDLGTDPPSEPLTPDQPTMADGNVTAGDMASPSNNDQLPQ